MGDTSKQKDAKQIAKNVAKRTEKINKNKVGKTAKVDARTKELVEYVSSFPPAIQARTIGYALAQVAPSEFYDKEEAKEAIRLFTSKPFMYHLKKVIEEHGIEEAFMEMEELDLDNTRQIVEYFTNVEYTDEEIEKMFQ